MIDPHLLRNDLDAVAENLKRRGYAFPRESFAEFESARKSLLGEVEKKRADINSIARKIGELKAQSDLDSADKIAALSRESAAIKEGLKQQEDALQKTQEQYLREILLDLPNLLDDSVPDGDGENDNKEIRRWGELPVMDSPKDHVALGESLGMMDFPAAAKMAGARFVSLAGPLARLHRALTQFMLDFHTAHHGYEEVVVPHLVNEKTLTGTGQLPKFGDELFCIKDDGFYLIPTAEVPVTNFAQDKIFRHDELPKKFVCHTPCYRREAGAHGKDTRGMLRQHQFDKVELVHISPPEDSDKALEELTSNAEKILRELKLPHRVVLLCAGDIGFAAAKTYDIEVWLPGQNRYREISSCSNCRDFQARRMMARFRAPQKKKTEFVHTLNGSGVAVGRALIAVMENYQQADGSIKVPPPLVSYMGGAEVISPK